MFDILIVYLITMESIMKEYKVDKCVIVQWNRDKNTNMVELLCFANDGKPPSQKFKKHVDEIGDGLTYAKKLAKNGLYEKILIRYV